MEMKVIESTAGIVEVALAGKLDTPGVAQIELRFTASLVPRSARAIVDLSKVDFIGSMGVRLFISVARALAKKQGKLVLFAPQVPVKEVLDMVSLGEMIPVTADLVSALAAANS